MERWEVIEAVLERLRDDSRRATILDRCVQYGSVEVVKEALSISICFGSGREFD